MRRLIRESAPVTYLKNCWDAAMWSESLAAGRLAARTLLDAPLVFFRNAAGEPVAMDDMCPHRLAPLRLGKLLPDGRIQCGYHGLEFDSSGQCMKNPHGKSTIPKQYRVKTYPLVEKHTLLWIWMSETSPNASLIPDFSYLDADAGYEVGRRDTIRMDANYRYPWGVSRRTLSPLQDGDDCGGRWSQRTYFSRRNRERHLPPSACC